MKINLALWDRILRYLIGIMLLTWAIAGGPWWTYTGLLLIITAAWGLCPVYLIIGVKTFHEKFSPFKKP